MSIQIRNFQFEVRRSGVFVRVPGVISAFFDRTGQGLTAVDWGRRAT